MFAFLKRRLVIAGIGLALISLLIWFVGADRYDWLEPVGTRIAAITVLVALFVVWEAFRRMRASQANNQLANAVVNQAKADQRPTADQVQLRERFEEAVATLQQQKKRGGQGLYELPWYVIIGAPGSGKTTALKYSGLKFPLEQRSGKAALRGVGGTRNCDWWFTEEAVLLDTAGRFTTQDSDASADSTGWNEFLSLLKKHRRRRPLNGVLLAISAQDLMTQGQAGREAHVAAARRRLNELNKELKIQLPVYVFVTKCDLIAGFTEYFEDMSQEDRAQVLGMTFAKDLTRSGAASKAFPSEFDAIVERLNERVYTRLEDDRDSRRRAKIFGFPQQMASLREGLAEFISDIFESTRFDQGVLLRGVYFTSGTQEGTPIDRLLGALGRRLSASAEAVVPPGRGKAFFIERLMKDVVLAESGLAGVSRRVEAQQALAQFGLYFGLLGLGALAVLLLTWSYRTNTAFLDDYRSLVTDVGRSMPPAGGTVQATRPRLDQFRRLVDEPERYRNNHWWTARGWGLDQSKSLEATAGGMYRQELGQTLVPAVRAGVHQRLQTLVNGGDELELYEALRVYLMLGNTDAAYFDRGEVRDQARKEWEKLYGRDTDDVVVLDQHFGWLVREESGLFPSSKIDEGLADQARQKITPDSYPRIVLSQVIRRYDNDHPEAAPIPAGQLKDRHNRPLGENFPAVFTEPAFRDADKLITETEATLSTRDSWFWKGKAPTNRVSRRGEIWAAYEDMYIARWTNLVKDLDLPSKPADLIAYVSNLTAERGGLKTFLETVDHHTHLVQADDGNKSSSWTGDLGSWFTKGLQDAKRWIQGKNNVPGARITYAFTWVHLLVTPPGKSPLDDILAKAKVVGEQLEARKPGQAGGDKSVEGGVRLSKAASDLKNSASGLPETAATVSSVIASVVETALTLDSANTSTGIDRKYSNVAERCGEVIAKYPFNRAAAADVGLDDFQNLFGGNGEFNRFVNDDLRQYAEQRSGVWTALQMPGGNAPNLSGILRAVNDAQRIREGFFPGGGELRFRYQLKVKDDDGRAIDVVLNDSWFEDGKSLKYDRSDVASRAKWAKWPGGTGDLTVTFTTDRDGRTSQPLKGEGPWSLFRLLDKATIVQVNKTVFDVTLRSGEFFVVLTLTASGDTNPLSLIAGGTLKNFQCGR